MLLCAFGFATSTAGGVDAAFAQSRTDLVINVSVSGSVARPRAAYVHAGDEGHYCAAPTRKWLPSATGPAPPRDGPASHVFGYLVTFGPDLPPGAAASLERDHNIRTQFWLEVFAAPNQEAGTAPIRLSRAFRVTMSAGGRLWQRLLEADAPPADGSVSIDRNGLGGRFNLRNLEPTFDHRPAPESERITVSGTWRCPAPK